MNSWWLMQFRIKEQTNEGINVWMNEWMTKWSNTLSIATEKKKLNNRKNLCKKFFWLSQNPCNCSFLGKGGEWVAGIGRFYRSALPLWGWSYIIEYHTMFLWKKSLAWCFLLSSRATIYGKIHFSHSFCVDSYLFAPKKEWNNIKIDKNASLCSFSIIF